MYSIKDIKRVGGTLYKNIATGSQFGKDINKAGTALGSSIYGAFDTARNINNGKYKDALKSYNDTRDNAKTAIINTAKGFGDVAYQAAAIPTVKDTGKAIQEKRYKDAALLTGLTALQYAPFVGKPAAIAAKAKMAANAANATSKTIKALNVAQKVAEAPSTRFMSQGSPSIISKVAPNTLNKLTYGYVLPGKTVYDYNKAYSEVQPQGSTSNTIQQPTPQTYPIQNQPSTTTQPDTIIKYNTTSASIPASNNQVYTGGTATAPAYQAPASYPINPTNTVNTTTLEGINAASGVQAPAITQPGVVPQPAGTTVDTSGTAQAAVNPQVQAKTDAYAAALKIAEAQAGVRLQGIMDKNLASQQQAMGMAADTYGGRAPAILGQSLTGVARDLNLNVQNESLKELETTGALGSTYDEAIRAAVEKQYADRINIAQKRANLIQQVAQIQGGRM